MSISVFKTSLGLVVAALFLQHLGKSSPSFLRDTISRQTSQSFGSYNLSTQNLRCRSWITDVVNGPPIRGGRDGQLFSVLSLKVSVWYKEKLLTIFQIQLGIYKNPHCVLYILIIWRTLELTDNLNPNSIFSVLQPGNTGEYWSLNFLLWRKPVTQIGTNTETQRGFYMKVLECMFASEPDD